MKGKGLDRQTKGFGQTDERVWTDRRKGLDRQTKGKNVNAYQLSASAYGFNIIIFFFICQKGQAKNKIQVNFY